MRKYLLLIVCFATCLGCIQKKKHFEEVRPLVNRFANQLFYRFYEPDGYKDIWYEDSLFGKYLKVQQLQPHGYPVHYYDGSIKQNKAAYEAVIDIPVDSNYHRDGIDIIMYLWADFLYLNSRYDEIQFEFTNGFNASYLKWQEGYRIKEEGDKCSWVEADTFNNDRETFLAFMDVVYAHTNAQTLDKQLLKVPYSDMRSGDVFIKQGDTPHVAIVVDVAHHNFNEKIFILAAGGTPAQELQVLANPEHPEISPWYERDTSAKEIVTPECTFSTSDFRRFKGN